MERPLTIWVVTDGRAGIEAQALGLAEAMARASPGAAMVVKRVRWRSGLRRLPTRLIAWPKLARDPSGDRPFPVDAEAWPDVWIGNGRAAVPFGVAARRLSHGATFVVQLQDPMRAPALFDLVIPPVHDRLEGPGVFPILGAPHRMTPERLAAGHAAFAARLEPLPHPRVLALIGGKARAFDLPPREAAALAERLRSAVERAGGSLLMTFSRRTPPAAARLLRERLADLPGWIWDGAGDNPLTAFLHAADHVVVTADSINMVAEAASTGKPVHIAAVAGGQARKDRFHAALSAHGAARPFDPALPSWTYEALRETERAAAEVLRRIAARRRGLDAAAAAR